MDDTTAEADRPVDVRRAFAEAAGMLAGLAALVYLTGALALQLRLGREGLPSSVAVPQLPREFLIGLGLLIVAPAIGLGFVVARLRLRASHSRRAATASGLVLGLACYLVVGGLVVAKDPFPAKVCLAGGGEIAGVLIGEAGSRTYLGDPRGASPRRVISIPQSQVIRVIVGGKPAQLADVHCDAG